MTADILTRLQQATGQGRTLDQAFKRQAANMAFLLNHAPLPDGWFDKFRAELDADVALFTALQEKENTNDH